LDALVSCHDQPVTASVCIIGAGPRGMSVLERICANARGLPASACVDVHVVDPHPPGPGRVWRTGQSGLLLMNTVASQVTLFTDDSVEMAGRLEPGPSLWEWARFLTLMGPADGVAPQTVAEARALGPDTYPTRAFYGRYLAWAFARVVRSAPPQVTVTVHECRAVALDDAPGGQTVRLADGTELTGVGHVVIALGHVPIAPTAEEAGLADFAAAHGLTYVPPGNPADVAWHSDLAAVPPGAVVALRGLGLNFFDHLTLLTAGRGGTYGRRAGRLVYHPSGREPHLLAGSRRGVPYHARGENEKGPHGRHRPMVLTPPVVAELRARGSLDFRRDLWPLIAKEVETVYYTTLARVRGCSCDADRFRAEYLPLEWRGPQERRLLREFGLADRPWDWDRMAAPQAGREITSPRDFRAWLMGYLWLDVLQARRGNLSNPVKAALDVLRDLRNEIRLLVDHAGLTGRSHARDLDGWYTPLNAFLSIGPPVRRIEEMIALIEAGVLEVTGPGTVVRPDPATGTFLLSSDVPGSQRAAVALIEARMPEIDMRRATDPLVRHLAATGQCRWHVVPDPAGPGLETGGLAVTERPYRLVDAAGVPHPGRYALGVPTESVHWVTAAGIRPAVNSVTLADSDAVALTVLGLAAHESRETGVPIGA
jgi:FAD-NAD(P)-binding